MELRAVQCGTDECTGIVAVASVCLVSRFTPLPFEKMDCSGPSGDTDSSSWQRSVIGKL